MSAPNQAQPTPTPATERLILIIEDDVSIAEALAIIVEDLGYAAIIATDGPMGLDLARSRRPNLILLDLMLPQLSGQQVIAQLRAEHTARGGVVPPIVVVTAAGRSQASAAGGDAIIVKPFTLETVEATLHRLLDGNHRV